VIFAEKNPRWATMSVMPTTAIKEDFCPISRESDPRITAAGLNELTYAPDACVQAQL
jgi:hypothetical protein